VTSFRQIEANRSRRNAVRHGLCAETVVGTLEDIEDYKGFEAAISADYDAETAVERELVLRLASLFWRIRRATAIETTLLQAEMVQNRCRLPGGDQDVISRFWSVGAFDYGKTTDADGGGGDDPNSKAFGPSDLLSDPARVLSLCFQRLVNFDGDVFERLVRYESALARQIVQVLFLLRSVRRR
jgi:hypothetical protein